MNLREFDLAFQSLTGNPPFPWQRALYQRFVSDRPDNIPDSCALPTGLGKTSVIAIWLIALANRPDRIPRRLVYVVNRRTVVDQSTREAEKVREQLFQRPELDDVYERLCDMSATPPSVPYRWEPVAISTLRGQFADNREWSTDASRPAIIVGTVDMIGSRLLFSGYGVGFKAKPLHAGFLGQEVLLVHDEAHLEPAFQTLLVEIQKEQKRCQEFAKFHVMELTATSRGGGEVFTLTDADRAEPEIRKRIGATKTIHLHENRDEKNLAAELADLALRHEGSGRAVLVFVRKVDDAEKVAKRLPKGRTKQLTGTLRGLERDRLVQHEIFRRFLPGAAPGTETVYLVCTSAGEVGVNISGDHLACDLSTFDSMAQRFGRVNRFGNRDDTRIDIVHPKKFDESEDDQARQKKTLDLLRLANGDGSPASLGELHRRAVREGSGTPPLTTDPAQALRDFILATFAPQPRFLPVSDILFDAWALTTIRGKLPGRPMVEPYLHGMSGWELPETHVAWREEVGIIITDDLREQYEPEGLLEDYPLKPHELLRDNSSRVFDRLKKLKAADDTPVWIVSDDGTVYVTTLAGLIDVGKEKIERKTVLLPPSAGGLDETGMFTGDSPYTHDVADEIVDERNRRRRVRVRDADENYETKTDDMRLVRRIELPASGEDDDEESRFWDWFELPTGGDTDGSRANKLPVLWTVHVGDVVKNATDIVSRLPLPEAVRQAIVFAARFHDHGKRRKVFQTILGNFKYPERVLAKSGKKGGRVPELYRHEFGSLVDLEAEPEFRAIADDDQKELIRHLIAVHHGYGRPHFSSDRAFDPEHGDTDAIAKAVPTRFVRLQRKYGRWGLAYLESLVRAADYAASASPSEFVEDEP